MHRKQTVAPATLAVSVSDLKLHLRIDVSDDDDLLEDLIEAAVAFAELQTSRAFITQTWQMTIDDFSAERIYLTPAPLQSVSSITYYDSNGDQQTLSSSVYQVVTENTPPYITLAPNQSYPSIDERSAGIVITYVTGYGDAASDVDKKAIQLVKYLTAHWYENREPVLTGTISTTLPFAVDSLIRSLTIPRFY